MIQKLFPSAFLKYSILLLVCFGFSIQITKAQAFLTTKDLSQFKVEMLTETDINKIKERLQGSELTLDQLKTQATAKGLPAAEFEKLKTRLSASSNTTNAIASKLETVESNRQQSVTGNASSFKEGEAVANNLVFGSELFQNTGSLASNANIATPLNYEVGPNDVLKVLLYGIQEFATELKVSFEGSVTVPNVGVIRVAGLTIEAAANKIQQQMARTAYKTLASGESKLSVTLSNIRTIHITIIGAKRPGTYDVSSLTTLFSALSIAGGPSPIGTYRNIELLRNNQPIRKVDLYRFILNGDQSDNVGLKDNDVIRIPAYQNRVEVNGQIKRPGIFELGGTEKFKNILEYAGGFDDAAYTENVKVIQKNGRELQVKDLSKTEFANYTPQGGDVFVVSKILNRYQNRIKLTGAVYRPDTYELIDGMRVSDLIKKADGLKEDAYLNSAQIFRQKADMSKEMLNLNLFKALNGDKKENIVLQKEDELFVSSVLDLKDSFGVTIYGEVHKPGPYNFSEGMTIKDLIIIAQGTNYFANNLVRVYRYYDEDRGVENQGLPLKTFNLEIDANLNFINGSNDIKLKPYDIVSITKGENNFKQAVVYIGGEVKKEGYYVLTQLNQKVSDIIKLAGGVKEDAFLSGVSVTRTDILDKRYYAKDTLGNYINEITSIPINLDEIFNKNINTSDLILKNGDAINVPKKVNIVTVLGAVVQPTVINYDSSLTIQDYIDNAGGLLENGSRNKYYVQYYNGKISKLKSFLFIKFRPKIEPGSKVFFVAKDKKEFNALDQFFKFTTTMSQIAAGALTLITLSKLVK